MSIARLSSQRNAMTQQLNISNAPRLRELLTDHEPVWLWDVGNGTILWANRAGVAFWGELDLVKLREKRFDHAMPGLARLRQLSRQDQLQQGCNEKLLFWTTQGSRSVDCHCQYFKLENGLSGLLLRANSTTKKSSSKAASSCKISDKARPKALLENPPSHNGQMSKSNNRGNGSTALSVEDREALQEIARMMQGSEPVAYGDPTQFSTHQQSFNDLEKNAGPFKPASNGMAINGAATNGAVSEEAFFFEFVEAVPAALAIHENGGLTSANKNFLYALGFGSLKELKENGGLNRLLKEDGQPLFGKPHKLQEADVSDTQNIVVRTKSSRRIRMIATQKDLPFSQKNQHILLLSPAYAKRTGRNNARSDHVRLFDILEQATDGFVILNEGGKILEASPQAQLFLSPSQQNLTNLALENFIAEKDREKFADTLKQLASLPLAHTDVLEMNIEIQQRDRDNEDGEAFTSAALTIGCFQESASGHFWVTFLNRESLINQVTVGKAHSQTQPPKTPTEDLDKTAFLAKVSHEVRTPLNSIIGFSEIMKDERFGPIGNTKYLGYLSDIYESANHALSLINNLLDISKAEAGRFDLECTPVDINNIANHCMSIMQPQASHARVVMRASLAANLPYIHADERSLKQIFLNLFSNAIKFTEPGGQVVISTKEESSRGVVIRVRDTGIGMSEDDIAEAMQPFRQLETARPQQKTGTGLGLPLTKALVEANFGKFHLQSTLGKGTLIEMTFPLNLAESAKDI